MAYKKRNGYINKIKYKIMELKTKYSVGDIVYVLHKDEFVKAPVMRIIMDIAQPPEEYDANSTIYIFMLKGGEVEFMENSDKMWKDKAEVIAYFEKTLE